MNFLIYAHLGNYENAIAQQLEKMQRDEIIRRIWDHDHTVWNPEPAEITNRLGWLTAPQTMQRELSSIHRLVDEVRRAGYRHVRVLGMGGASLAAEVFQKAFGQAPGYLDCAVIDSTHPHAVLATRREVDLSKTLFIVSIKKYALETVSLFKYFYNAVAEVIGTQQAGRHFVAITDPGSWVNDLAAEYKFRHVCLNDPNISGRYSPLTYVGLLPAALMGVDIDRFLALARPLQEIYGPSTPSDSHLGAWMGAVLGKLALHGRDKLTIITTPHLAGFADWVEQLLAESTGKAGTGILPIVHEKPVPPAYYGTDRVFVAIELDGEPLDEAWLRSLSQAGHPVLRFRLASCFELAEQFYFWCFATAVAGYCLGINPFDQPNIEATKEHTRQLLDAIQQGHTLSGQRPIVTENRIRVYADQSGNTITDILNAFLAALEPGAYIALQAYLPPTAEIDQALQKLRQNLLKRSRSAVTLGYGPRFLHSTGQLHKGDKGNGFFIQFTSSNEHDVGIPDQAGKDAASISFNTLIMAQALGDGQALEASNRRLVRFHLSNDLNDDLRYLVKITR